MWGYYWGYTSAQIELLAVDCPLIVYDSKSKKKKRKDGTPKVDFQDVKRKSEEWSKKYSDENDKITFDLTGFA